MSDNVETMAHNPEVIETPWHGNSTAFIGTLWDTAIEAGIDWTVSARMARVRIGEDTDDTFEVPDQYFIVRDTDNRVYGKSVSGRYEPVQNMAILEFFQDYADKGGVQLASIGSLKNGAIIFATAKTGKSFTIKGMDATDQYITFARSHDGTMSNEIWNSLTCVVCCNTLKLAQKDQKKNGCIKKKSTKNFNMMGLLSEAKTRLGYAIQEFEAFHETAEFLAERPADFNGNLVKEFLVNLTAPKDLKDLVSGFVPGMAEKLVTDDTMNRVALKIADRMITGPGQELSVRQNTWWGVLSGVTDYVDHVAQQGKGTVLASESAILGTGAALKDRALELVQVYANL